MSSTTSPMTSSSGRACFAELAVSKTVNMAHLIVTTALTAPSNLRVQWSLGAEGLYAPLRFDLAPLLLRCNRREERAWQEYPGTLRTPHAIAAMTGTPSIEGGIRVFAQATRTTNHWNPRCTLQLNDRDD
jgi:hypothetical protein